MLVRWPALSQVQVIFDDVVARAVKSWALQVELRVKIVSTEQNRSVGFCLAAAQLLPRPRSYFPLNRQ